MNMNMGMEMDIDPVAVLLIMVKFQQIRASMTTMAFPITVAISMTKN